MRFEWEMLVVFGFPVALFGLALGYAAYHRHLKHKERMAMIEKGIAPPDLDRQELARVFEAARKPSPTSAVTITLVGVAITLGMLTLGIGPWLIAGLVPTAVGTAMLLQQFIEEARRKRDDE